MSETCGCSLLDVFYKGVEDLSEVALLSDHVVEENERDDVMEVIGHCAFSKGREEFFNDIDARDLSVQE